MANLPSSTKLTLQGIEFEVRRKGQGRPLLLLHGGGGALFGKPFADSLAERFEIIEPVHPGFGGSPIPDRFDSIEDLVYLYLDLMDALGLEDAVLVGQSMGGWAAAEIAVRTTQRISKLILVDAVGIKPGDRDTRDIADLFATDGKEIAKLMWHDLAFAPQPAALTDDELKIAAANRTALALYTWEPYMHNPKLPDRLHRIDVPTLLIWGASDGVVTPEYGRAFCDLIPGARLEVIERAGHSPHIEQPEEFVRRVIDFAAA
jgi:pimeloyl-ACP methyl ester carboxylesterase